MSVKIVNAVWEHCQHTGNALLLMLAIADHADDTGRAWPGIARLAHKVRVTERTIYNLIKDLEAAGDLIIHHGGGRNKVNHYQINLKKFQCNSFTEKDSLKVATQNPESCDIKTLKQVSPEPSVEPSKNRQRERGASAPQATSAPTQPKPKQPGKSASRIPHQELPDAWRQYCQQHRPDLDPAAVWENFRDYWLAAPGQRGRKQDWDATWRTWVRREDKRSTAHVSGQPEERLPIRMPHVLWMTQIKRARAPDDPVVQVISRCEQQQFMTAAQYQQLRAAGMKDQS